MRYKLADGTIVTHDQTIEVPMDVTIPAVMGEKAVLVDREYAEGEEKGYVLEPCEVELERVEPQMFNMRIMDMDQAERDRLGIVEIVEDPRPDDRFYFVTENEEEPGKWVATPKDLDMLKTFWVGEIKTAAGRILALTDWKVTKAFETAVALDEVTANYRATVRALSNTLEGEINSSDTVEDLIEVVGNIQWPAEE